MHEASALSSANCTWWGCCGSSACNSASAERNITICMSVSPPETASPRASDAVLSDPAPFAPPEATVDVSPGVPRDAAPRTVSPRRGDLICTQRVSNDRQVKSSPSCEAAGEPPLRQSLLPAPGWRQRAAGDKPLSPRRATSRVLMTRKALPSRNM
eukprot:Gregarina_sp_Pseudo_9__756@NODE_1485_length_1556_cov_2_771918_g1375_i0_p2_GENE_NODE_1485_length_1556_cov_2_771918_g1375_i0NODE_1485_length_1556_cov_2_771918_g1375_i0_p2_ORF_typecomplete_len156_score33_24DUF2272/PF10030_9/0_041_NODE_1485_length_1556_cov_2_771918_g1375_i08481315